jgi:hypothetical protein
MPPVGSGASVIINLKLTMSMPWLTCLCMIQGRAWLIEVTVHGSSLPWQEMAESGDEPSASGFLSTIVKEQMFDPEHSGSYSNISLALFSNLRRLAVRGLPAKVVTESDSRRRRYILSLGIY